MAEPSMEGSKREEPPVEATELDEEVVEACNAASTGLLCCRLGAWRSEAR